MLMYNYSGAGDTLYMLMIRCARRRYAVLVGDTVYMSATPTKNRLVQHNVYKSKIH